LGVEIYAISVDSLENAQKVVSNNKLSFTVAYGATEEDRLAIGAWRSSDDHGEYIQPAEFLLGRGGVVLGSMYASGPVGRMRVDEAISLITNRERRRLNNK
jgi:peroxiredoxin|tara:strand:- start:359 stop:661 length:303 start_codon:yes stop_codon:yes gene_type:complete